MFFLYFSCLKCRLLAKVVSERKRIHYQEKYQRLIKEIEIHKDYRHFKNKNKQYTLVANTVPKILIDVSGMIKSFPRVTGISRTVLSVLNVLLDKGVPGYEISPVYMTSCGFRLANKFLKAVWNITDGKDRFFESSPSDIFIGMEHNVRFPENEKFFDEMKNTGTRIYFFLYDILPLRFPDYFPDYITENFGQYLRFISKYDGVITDSKSVAEEYTVWRKNNFYPKNDHFFIRWTHLGSDLQKHYVSTGIPEDAGKVFDAMAKRMSCLMVSTVEPRKGYRQALCAFEYLWANGFDGNLVIVGNAGWKMEDFIEKLNHHPERNKRLFWLAGISDEYLGKLYEKTSGVLMASEGEGFGLAVIECTGYGKPLLCRDLPVFWEVAGDNARYFSDDSEIALAVEIKSWFQSIQNKSVPDSGKIRGITWERCAFNIVNAVINQ